jgi:deazaflavin-dependent oxidoreductase (nitroreductase family)
MTEQPYLRPPWFVARVMNPVLMLLGRKSTLAVTGRSSGKTRVVPVNVLDLDGNRYLVAVRGETEWVRNLRAAGEGELRQRGRVQPFRPIEVADKDKPRIIDAYRERWDKEVKGLFEQLPDPADHPVFRMQPIAKS